MTTSRSLSIEKTLLDNVWRVQLSKKRYFSNGSAWKSLIFHFALNMLDSHNHVRVLLVNRLENNTISTSA